MSLTQSQSLIFTSKYRRFDAAFLTRVPAATNWCKMEAGQLKEKGDH